MVHWQNVEYIIQNGLCSREHPKADPQYINIGHRQLIADRHEYSIPLPGAGSLGEYVPFYFAGHSPMLFLIINGYGGVVQRPQEDIVFIVSTVDQVSAQGLEFIFTDRNAKIAIAEYFNDLKDLDKIHWDIVKSRHWANDESNIARRDFKQAEFLVRHYLPVQCITFVVVKTEQRKAYFEEIISNLGLSIQVYVDYKCKLYY